MTEIAPGMMVEAVAGNLSQGRKAFVTDVFPHLMCDRKHGPCASLVLLNWPSEHYTRGWAACCFKPIGGDKEIEQKESQRTGKSAKGDMRNGDDHPNKINFFIIDMDDK